MEIAIRPRNASQLARECHARQRERGGRKLNSRVCGFDRLRRLRIRSAAWAFLRQSSEQICAKALATTEMPENLRAFVSDPVGAESYPIVTFTRILLRSSYGNAQ